MSMHTEKVALLDTEKALIQYHEKLETNIKTLINAGEVCDAAMGSDDLCQHYIGEMEKAIKCLRRAADEVDDLRREVRKKIEQFEVIERMGL